MRIGLGGKASFGTTSVSLREAGENLIISVGEMEIPITFTLESGDGGYGYGCLREMLEEEARMEYAAYIKDYRFGGLHKNTIEGMEINDWHEDSEEISFILCFYGEMVIMPGGWTTQIGKVTIKNGELSIDVQ